MNYAKVQHAVLRSPLFLAASNAAIGIWLKTTLYVVEQLGSGRIPGARRWPEASWMVGPGITVAERDQALGEGLFRWEGDDLVLEGYNQQAEDGYRAQVEGGKRGGRPRKPKVKTQGKNPTSDPRVKPNPKALTNQSIDPSLREGGSAPPKIASIDDAMGDVESDHERPSGYPERDVLDRTVMPGSVADLVAGFGAVVTDVDRQDWDALIRHHGFTRVSDACENVRRTGQRAWLSHVRDQILARVQAAETWPQRAWKSIRDILLMEDERSEEIRATIEEAAGQSIPDDATEGKIANYALKHCGQALDDWIAKGWVPPRDF